MKIAAAIRNSPLMHALFGACMMAALCRGLAALKPAPVPAGKAQEGAPVGNPQRIASLCLQGDDLLLELVARERIVALSALAADPDISAQWKAAQGIPVHHGGAEELIRLKPDLVLVSAGCAPLTTAILRQCGVPTLELGIPADFGELREQIVAVGRSLGETARAESMARELDARLERLRAGRPAEGRRPSAMFYFQDRFVPGAHSFAQALLDAAGFQNLAAAHASGGGIASLESVVMARPQYLILTQFREGHPAWTQLSVAQPLFGKWKERIVSVPFRQLAQPDFSNVELAEMLQAQISR